MQTLAQEGVRVNVIVTSPPYNIKKQYSQYKDNKERTEYLDWLEELAEKSLAVLDNEGSFFLNIAGTPSDPFLALEAAQRFQKAGYVLQNTIHWIKSISFEKDDVGKSHNLQEGVTMGSAAIGHFKPIVSDRFLTDCHEYIFHFTKDGNVKLDKLAIGVPYQDKTNIGRWKSAKQDRRDRGNTWFIPYPTITESRPHPAVFPEKLPYLCIKLHGIKPGMIVYDPFMGIGTTALACTLLGLNYLGTDIDKGYIKIAEEQLAERRKAMKKQETPISKIVDWVSDDELVIGSN
jgi:site-specific DNA-methyltransferase (adenine-specific)